MDLAETFRETVAKMVTIFDRFGVRFHLTGGGSTIACGEPRMTQDIDLVVDPQAMAANVGLFLEAVRETGFLVDEETAKKGVTRAGVIGVRFCDGPMPVIERRSPTGLRSMGWRRCFRKCCPRPKTDSIRTSRGIRW